MFTDDGVKFFQDRVFFKTLTKLAIPMIVQYFISSSLNLVDGLMIGQLGETTVASVGLANQVFFLLNFLLFGVGSGAGIFSAQFWGKGDVKAIHRVLGLGITMGVVGAAVFTLLALVFPAQTLSVYTEDPAVIEMGSRYLRIVGYGYIFFAITFSYTSILRSVGAVRVPMVVAMVALGVKTLISYVLIFGLLGFPQMGLLGAAVGTLVARIVEFSLILLIVYSKRLPPAALPREMFSFSWPFVSAFIKTALPVAINETLWSLGISTYNMIYAHIGTTSIAAINICNTIENLAFVIFIGLSDACGIMVGHNIGSGHEKRAIVYSRRLLLICVTGAILMGGVIFLVSGPLLSLYKVSPEVIDNARRVLMVISTMFWIRISNMVLIVGIMRSGGDTRFALWLDAGTVWCLGVPLAALGAFVFHLPVYWVYTLVMAEELAKFGVALWRFFSLKWVNNLAHTAAL